MQRMGALTRAEQLDLWIAAGPAATLTLATVLYEPLGQTYASLAAQLLLESSSRPMVIRVMHVGMGWKASALVYLLVCAGVLLILTRYQRKEVRAAASRPYQLLFYSLAGLNLASLGILSSTRQPLSALFFVTIEALQRSELMSTRAISMIGGIVMLINVLVAVIIARFISLTPLCVLPPADGWNEISLMERTRQSRMMMMLASVFLVAGVLHMSTWTFWAGLLVGSEKLADISSGVVAYWAIAFALMIAAFTIPVQQRLAAAAEAVMAAEGVPAAEQAQWLDARQLSSNWLSQFPQGAAIASPLLAGLLSNLVRRHLPLPGLS